jgi:hypothetical protein
MSYTFTALVEYESISQRQTKTIATYLVACTGGGDGRVRNLLPATVVILSLPKQLPFR